ncbi:MAG: ribosome assembly factor SBDS [Nanoarchaeota archaeon]
MKGNIPQTFDGERAHFNVARIKKSGETFEVVVDPDAAVKFRETKQLEVREVLKSEHIFVNASKGEMPSADELQKAFHTADELKVAEIIIREGEIQLTAEHRQKVREEKMKKIIQLIHINAIDPKTNTPHPETRIRNAFAEAKIHIDEFRRAEDQISDIIKKLQPIIPIRFETKTIDIQIPANYAAKMYQTVTSYGKIKDEQWLNDGSWHVIVTIPAGLQNEFFDELNGKTHGSVQINLEAKK